MKHTITLEIDSTKEMERILSPYFGALIFCANDNWKVLSVKEGEE